MNKLLIGLLVSIGISSVAVAEGDPAKGQMKAAACAACHGVDGNALAPTFPKIAGQNPSYIVKQLKDISEGKRVAPVMMPFAGMVNSDEDRANVAAYFASQAVKPGNPVNPEQAAAGKEIYLSGIADKGVAACTACHGPSGEGNDLAVFPQLKAQHAFYTTQQLKAFRDGKRANDPANMMGDIAGKLSDEEIAAVSAYIQSM